MTTYAEIQAQIAALQQRAEQVRKAELAAVIDQIKATMAQYGLTIDDLGTTKKSRKTGTVAAKYRDPISGATWTGRGIKPKWMQAAIANGQSVENFLI